MILIFSIVIMVNIPYQLSRAQSISEAGALFLTFPPGSRANAMGGAHTALLDDIYALYFNPANIIRVEKGAFGFYNHQWSGSRPITFTGGVYSSKYGSFGFAFNNFDIDIRGPFGEELNSYERAFQLTYAHKVSPKVSVGGTIKFVQEFFDQPQGISDASANAWAFDIGILI
ncbi:MAG: hypothetical protein D6813_01890, partial [Calditrichaeota bacterium]